MFARMPEELELLTLSFLSGKELSNVALVCKHGLRLSQDSSLALHLIKKEFLLQVPAGIDARQYYLSQVKKLRDEQSLLLMYLRALNAIISKNIPGYTGEQNHLSDFQTQMDLVFSVGLSDASVYAREVQENRHAYLNCADEFFSLEEDLFQAEGKFKETAAMLFKNCPLNDTDFFQKEIQRFYRGIKAEGQASALSDLLFMRILCYCRADVSFRRLHKQLPDLLKSLSKSVLGDLLVHATKRLNVTLVTMLLDAGASVNETVRLPISPYWHYMLSPLHILLISNNLEIESARHAAKIIISKLVEKGADLNGVGTYAPSDGSTEEVENFTVIDTCDQLRDKPQSSAAVKEMMKWIAGLLQPVAASVPTYTASMS